MEVNLNVGDDFDRDVFDRCVASLKEIVERPDEVRLTVTTDFVTAVREKVSDRDYAAAYEQDRRFARAMGKTIPQADGTMDLVMAAGLLSPSLDPRVAEWSFRHEAYHIAINQRGEALNDIRRRLGIDGAPGIYLATAGIACEEFRVESALWHNSDYGLARMSSFEETALRLDEHVRTASRQYQDDEDVGAISHTVMDTFSAVANWTAYLAAEIQVTGEALSPNVPPDVDKRVLGEPWRTLAAEVARVPSATVPTDRSELDRHAMEVAKALAVWLGHIGFSWEGTKEDDLYFHVHKPEQWVP